MVKDLEEKARLRWHKAIMNLREKGEEYKHRSLPNASMMTARSSRRQRDRRASLYLNHGKAHTLWIPNQHSVKQPMKQKQELLERRKSLLSRVKATQHVLKIQKGELAKVSETSEEEEEEKQGKEEEEEKEGNKGAKQSDGALAGRGKRQHAVKNVVGQRKSGSKKIDVRKLSLRFHDIVSQYVAAMPQSTSQSESLPMDHDKVPSLESTSEQDGAIPFQKWKRQFIERQQSKEEREKDTKGSPYTITLSDTRADTPLEQAEITEATSVAEPN